MVWPFPRSNGSAGGGKKGKPAPDAYQEYAQYRLSRLIIVGAFAFIGAILVIHYVSLNSVLLNNSKNETAIDKILDSVDQSNLTIFNILLPVFGAWVGVVVAFCFGSEQARRAQEVLVRAISSEEEKLSTTKVQSLLDKFPTTKNIHQVTLDSTIRQVKDAFDGLSDVLVVKDNKPLGILYQQDLNSVLPADEKIS